MTVTNVTPQRPRRPAPLLAETQRPRLEPGGRRFTATDTVHADHQFVAPARGNHTVAASSRCAALLKAGATPAETDNHVAHD